MVFSSNYMIHYVQNNIDDKILWLTNFVVLCCQYDVHW